MTPSFEALQKQLKLLPGVGYRSAERMAIHLLLEKPQSAEDLLASIQAAISRVKSCPNCGNICEEEDLCKICQNPKRNEDARLCIVEHVSDLMVMEKSGSYDGLYHVLGGKLSPINGIGPNDINFASLKPRIEKNSISEIILALTNDIEGEATCHYIGDALSDMDVTITRIGFGLPSGGSILYSDPVTLKSALDARKSI
ncbi:recombination mediator RecR [Puniceicoccaceae bacterium K14]|nr:recombination mediator RecR [Puniceicoccaceae bacterium K14]